MILAGLPLSLSLSDEIPSSLTAALGPVPVRPTQGLYTDRFFILYKRSDFFRIRTKKIRQRSLDPIRALQYDENTISSLDRAKMKDQYNIDPLLFFISYFYFEKFAPSSVKNSGFHLQLAAGPRKWFLLSRHV